MNRRAPMGGPDHRRGGAGSALVAVLWCLVLLGVVVVSMLHATRLDLRVVKNHADAQQAYYLALAGVEKAKALLFAEARSLRASGQSYSARLFDDPQDFRSAPLGRGFFRVVRSRRADEAQGRVVYGLSDEESRLNLNTASLDELKRLPGMADPIAAAVIDWRDDDGTLTPQGAEIDDYAALSPPYVPRNRPLESTLELLMVRGVSPELLLGEDTNANGLLDPEEDDGPRTMPMDNGDGVLDRAWSELVTVDSSARNLNARGEARVNIKTASEDELAAVNGISRDIARAIVAYRNEHSFESLVDLLEVTPPRQPGEAQAAAPPAAAQEGTGSSSRAAPAGLPSQGGRTPAPGSSPTAPLVEPAPPVPAPATSPVRLISEDLLKQIADDLTTETGYDLEGAVNINTAGRIVLACLPGMSQDLAAAIVNHRTHQGPFSNIAGLLNVPGVSREIFKQVFPRVTVRSETFRIVAEGLVPSTGASKRLEVVVRVSRYAVETLYYREEL